MSTSDDQDGIFAARLREARGMRQLNQAELGKLAGLQPAAIGHFEAGRRKPSFANIRSLARALNVSSDFLLGRSASLEGSTTAFRGEENLTHANRESIQMMIDMFSKQK